MRMNRIPGIHDLLELVSSILKKEGEKGVKDYFILYYKVLLIKVRSIILPTAGFTWMQKQQNVGRKRIQALFSFFVSQINLVVLTLEDFIFSHSSSNFQFKMNLALGYLSKSYR